MSKRCLMALLGVFVAIQAGVLRADVKLPAIIGSNMVLQTGKPVPIWGWADAGEKVTVTFGEQKQDAVADAQGNWKVTLKPLQVGEPLKMTVAGKNTLTLDNVLVGSVWICSGQSNMEFGLKMAHNSATEIPAAKYPKMRLFLVPHNTALTPQTDIPAAPNAGKWVECTPDTVAAGGWQGFTAVGYFFGRDVLAATSQPVGLIETNWGGTPAQSWTSFGMLAKTPELKHYIDTPLFNEPQRQADIIKANFEKAQAAYDAAQKKWEEESAAAKAAGTKFTKPAPRKPVADDKNPWTPAALYNGMINPLIPYAIEGAIWYQGESNASPAGAVEYRTLFPRMISDWREKWGQGDFPFLFVQIASYDNNQPHKTEPSESGWAMLREAQLMTLSLPKTGMAVTIDIGEGGDIHPKDKADVGHRLALAAQKVAFGKDIVCSGPIYKEMKIDGNQIRVSFTNIGSGLVIGSAPPIRLDTTQKPPADHLTGFAICGEDHTFVWADAKIVGDTVVVSNDKVAKPVAVRYAWADCPDGNLYNKENLPASPFRTDTFEK